MPRMDVAHPNGRGPGVFWAPGPPLRGGRGTRAPGRVLRPPPRRIPHGGTPSQRRRRPASRLACDRRAGAPVVNGDGPDAGRMARGAARRGIDTELSALEAERTALDADQTLADADQTASDADQT